MPGFISKLNTLEELTFLQVELSKMILLLTINSLVIEVDGSFGN